MKPVVLYAGAAIVGIGAAIFLFASPMGGASSGAEPGDETTTARPSGGGATPGAEFGPDEGGEEGGGPNAKQGTGGRRDPAANTQGPRPGTEELSQAMNSPFGQHGRKAAPALQALANALTDQGATELAGEATAIVGELRQQRRSLNVDTASFVAKERALIQKVKDAGHAEAVSGEIARLEALIVELETGVGAPAAPDAPGAGAGAQ
jgi:hypothetical protein